MKKKRFGVEQIVAVLKKAEAGMPAAEMIRRIGVTEQTVYRRKKQYADLDAIRRGKLRQLQEENERLKKRRLSGTRAVWPGAQQVYSYKSCRNLQTLLRLRMKELAMTRMRYAYSRNGVLLKREGFCHSIGMLYRVYPEEGLSLRYRDAAPKHR